MIRGLLPASRLRGMDAVRSRIVVTAFLTFSLHRALITLQLLKRSMNLSLSVETLLLIILPVLYKSNQGLYGSLLIPLKRVCYYCDLLSLLRFLSLLNSSPFTALISSSLLLRFWSLIWLGYPLPPLSVFSTTVRYPFRLQCHKGLSAFLSSIVGIVKLVEGPLLILLWGSTSKFLVLESLHYIVYPCKSSGKIFGKSVNLPSSNQISNNGWRLSSKVHAPRTFWLLMRKGLSIGIFSFRYPRNLKPSSRSKFVFMGRKYWLIMPFLLLLLGPISLTRRLKKACMSIGRTQQAWRLLGRRIVPTVLYIWRTVFPLFKDWICCKRSASRVVG